MTHGQFLHNLVLAFWPHDEQLLKSYMFIPINNSLTIIDFDVKEYETNKGEKGQAVTPRLVSHNLQIIENNPVNSRCDY